MAGIIAFQRSIRKILPVLNRRWVSTSKKNNETITAEVGTAAKAVVEKNWQSYGFDVKSKKDDRNAMHSIFFISITIITVAGGFFLAYLPDFNLRDWSQREAFLQLRYREANGLPLIDPNVVDPAKIHLPSDEELGDTEIII